MYKIIIITKKIFLLPRASTFVFFIFFFLCHVVPPPIIKNPISVTFIRSFGRWRYSSEKCVSFLKNRIHHWSPQPPSSFSPILRQKKTRSFPFHSPSQISSNISTTRWLLEFSLNFKIKKKEKPNFHHTSERIFPKILLVQLFHLQTHLSTLSISLRIFSSPRKSKIQNPNRRIWKKKEEEDRIADKTSRPWTRATSAILKSGRQRQVGGPWTDPRQGNIQHLSKGSRVALWNRVIWPLAVLQISSSSASRSFHVFATHPSHRAS